MKDYAIEFSIYDSIKLEKPSYQDAQRHPFFILA
jgi:hypothetical protein